METGKWTDTAGALRLLARQRSAWPVAGAAYEALARVQVKRLCVDGLRFEVQYNPARIRSSAAQTDAQSLRERPCFLCPSQLPAEQEALPMGNDFLLLCNPFPIFPEHFTIASRRHEPQQIGAAFAQLPAMARSLSGLTLLYNGPQCGASAPDHLHFQAVTASYMPIDKEAWPRRGEACLKEKDGAVFPLSGYLRNGFILESTTESGACSLFKRLCRALQVFAGVGEAEPRMNLFCRYEEERWRLILIPRLLHRPRQYYAQGDDQLLTAPGAADVGGIFITVRESDFEKTGPELLRDVYAQIAYGDPEIQRIAAYLRMHG